jgi:hypothetical protein
VYAGKTQTLAWNLMKAGQLDQRLYVTYVMSFPWKGFLLCKAHSDVSTSSRLQGGEWQNTAAVVRNIERSRQVLKKVK